MTSPKRKLPLLWTSHASIAYRKQLPPQRTVGTIGSIWQESTPSKETTGPAQTNTQSETMKTNSRKWQMARAAFALAKNFLREHRNNQPLTGSHRCWTYFEQAGTNGTPT